MQKIKFKKAYIHDQWHDGVSITIDENGLIAQISVNEPDTGDDSIQCIDGYALPGISNIHSHAFQRAMAGLSEYSTSRKDSFWTWRDVMYRFAQSLTPDDLYHIARQLYMEMLIAGYTSVAEFHYLHHQSGGTPYDTPSEMSDAILAAARDVGIALTHLPVLYMASGFGNQPLSEEQSRFGNTVESYCRLLDDLHAKVSQKPDQRLGIAFHSLRAVPPSAFDGVISHLDSLDDKAPIHIHCAEQVKEVQDCLIWSGLRPVEWLLEHHDLSSRWCLIHATHLTDDETERLAKSGAIAGICPTTEANLGDGIFPLKKYIDHGGTIAIGSDSHISISPVEELRLMEYGQRLITQGRNIISSPKQPHTGDALYHLVTQGGAKATARDTGEITIGKRADFITLDPSSALLTTVKDDFLLDQFIFNGNVSPVKDVMIGGTWKMRDYRHPRSAEITTKFKETMAKLL